MDRIQEKLPDDVTALNYVVASNAEAAKDLLLHQLDGIAAILLPKEFYTHISNIKQLEVEMIFC